MLNLSAIKPLSLGFILTGFLILIFFQTNVGAQWLHNRAQWVRERFFESNLDESKQRLLYGLEILARDGFGATEFVRDRSAVSNSASSRREEGILRDEGILKRSDDGFDEVIEYLEQKHRSNSAAITQFEPISINDDVVRLERVEAGHEGVIDTERGVPPGLGRHIHAVMEDGSRKIVLDPGYAYTFGRNLAKREQKKERMRRRRIENRFEDWVKWSVAIIWVIGFGLQNYL